MSLVNQMLRDLDKRRAINEAQRVSNDVRPLPPGSALPVRLYVLIGSAVLLVLSAVGTTWFFMSKPAAQVEIAASLPAPVIIAKTDMATPNNAIPPQASSLVIEAPAPESKTLTDKPAEHAVLHVDALNPVLALSPKIENKAVSAASEKATDKNKGAPKESKPGIEKNKMPTPIVTEAKQHTGQVALAGNAAIYKSESAVGGIRKTEPITTPRERAENEYRKALNALNQGRNNDALDNLQAALHQDEMHYAARQLLINMLIELHRTDEAMQALRSGLQGQPGQVGWAMSLARLQVDQGQLDAAWATLEQSLPAGARNAPYQGFAGHVLQRMKRYKDAISHFAIATQIAPNDGRWWLGLGLAFEAEGMVNEAREAFARARQGSNLSPELVTLIEQKLR